LSLQTGDVEKAFARMAAGDLGFSGAVGQLLDKYKALSEQGRVENVGSDVQQLTSLGGSCADQAAIHAPQTIGCF
jgi:hypothetical protein